MAGRYKMGVCHFMLKGRQPLGHMPACVGAAHHHRIPLRDS